MKIEKDLVLMRLEREKEGLGLGFADAEFEQLQDGALVAHQGTSFVMLVPCDMPQDTPFREALYAQVVTNV